MPVSTLAATAPAARLAPRAADEALLPPPVLAPAPRAAAPDRPPALAARPRLAFLDGIRGLAALYVVVHHISQIYMDVPTAGYYWFTPLMQLGHYAVAIFIVLSGFCLMLPVAQSPDGTLRGGLGPYIWRRVKRIVPAYYAAIALFCILVALVPTMRRHDGELMAFAFGGADVPWQNFFEWKNLLAHVLVLHALSPNWINRIDPPMWSIGVEWLNYFLLPLLFLPLWRRLGNVLLVAIAMVLCFLPYGTMPLLHHERFTLHWMQPWFIALFAIGMAGAGLQFARHTPRWVRRAEDLLLTMALHPFMLVALAVAMYMCRHQRVPLDFLVGAATICLILHCSRDTLIGRGARRVLESRAAMFLGAISYSLYLFHVPLLMLLYRGLETLDLGAGLRLSTMVAVGMPLAVLLGWGAYRLFERPFMYRAG
jgi:peptidoglycan/LPS O-acetylase OafA/YrhL